MLVRARVQFFKVHEPVPGPVAAANYDVSAGNRRAKPVWRPITVSAPNLSALRVETVSLGDSGRLLMASVPSRVPFPLIRPHCPVGALFSDRGSEFLVRVPRPRSSKSRSRPVKGRSARGSRRYATRDVEEPASPQAAPSSIMGIKRARFKLYRVFPAASVRQDPF